MRIKKIFVFVFLILFLPVTVIQAKKIATLSELMNPDMIALEYNRIFITEGASIYIYSLKDFRLIKKFGKEGEGPREFKLVPIGFPMRITLYDHKLFVNSQAKVSVFTKDGEFIKETKVMPNHLFEPFKNKFVSIGTASDDEGRMVLSVNLHNETFERIKELYVSDMRQGASFMLNFPLNPIDYHVYKDRLYSIAGKEGFIIEVFDEKGTKLERIKKDFKPLKVTEEYKNKTLDWFKTQPNYKQVWELIKTRITFRTFYPPIQDMLVKDGRIYILTFETRKRDTGDKKDTECIIMDLKGNEQKRVFIPHPQLWGMDYLPKYDFYNRGFYFLVENDAEETWELHKSDAIK